MKQGKLVFNFTIVGLEKVPAPEKGMRTYKDSKQPGLSIYITSNGTKTFFVRKRIKGRDERVIIGKFPEVKIEQARSKAAIICGIIADKKDPKQEERDKVWFNMTFEDHFEEYMERYSKSHKKTWKHDQREIKLYASQWNKRKLGDIKKDDIERLHEKIGKENGRVQANKILSRLTTIFNKAIEWGWKGENPTRGVKKYKEKSRDRFILPHEMPFILKALNEETDQSIKDYFTLLFYTGVRKTNSIMMRWDDIIWEHKEWKVPITKNSNAVTVPLVEPLYNLLLKRKEESKSAWVFPKKSDSALYMPSPREAWLRILAKATFSSWEGNHETSEWMKKANKKFTRKLSPKIRLMMLLQIAKEEGFTLPKPMNDICIHDIRRTFGSYQALTGASISIIGKSLGHTSLQATQIYARLNLDPVRASVEKATAVMFQIARPTEIIQRIQ